MNFHEHCPLTVDAQRAEAIRRALAWIVREELTLETDDRD